MPGENNRFIPKYEVRDRWLSEISYVNSKTELNEDVLSKLQDNASWDEPFFVANFESVLENYKLWKKELPNVEVFYAVKANDDPMVLRMLAALGASFDCATKGEMESVMNLGVTPDQIVYSNPYKVESHLEYATAVGVRWMSCDSLDELNKIQALSPQAKVVIRITPRKEKSQYVKFSDKFGCNFDEAMQLLVEAKKINVAIEGISFYVGHCTECPDPYADAIKLAKELFIEAQMMGHHIKLLDIGGGFQGQKEKRGLFLEIAASIREALEYNFPPSMNVKCIGEPGQYMVVESVDVYAKIIGIRIKESPNGEKHQSVYVSAGHYGGLPNFNFKYYKSKVEILKSHNVMDYETNLKTTFWGPTCDPMDCLVTLDFPSVSRGQWVRFTNFGGYARSLMTKYNGFPLPPTKYYMTQKIREALEDI